MKKSNILMALLTAGLVQVLTGCEPKPDSAELLDEFVVQTNRDKDAVFTNYDTYTIQIDTIALYSNVPGAPSYLLPKDSSPSGFTTDIIDQIIKNMDDRGYTRVAKKEDPDLALNVFIIYNYSQYSSVVYSGGYGSGYYGYGGYGYGGYSPYYVQTTETNRGSLNIEMVDLKNIVNNKVKVIWYSTMGDLFNAVDQGQQSLDAIDQSFVQSPYISN